MEAVKSLFVPQVMQDAFAQGADAVAHAKSGDSAKGSNKAGWELLGTAGRVALAAGALFALKSGFCAYAVGLGAIALSTPAAILAASTLLAKYGFSMVAAGWAGKLLSLAAIKTIVPGLILMAVAVQFSNQYNNVEHCGHNNNNRLADGCRERTPFGLLESARFNNSWMQIKTDQFVPSFRLYS